jgi:hypothetical protein
MPPLRLHPAQLPPERRTTASRTSVAASLSWPVTEDSWLPGGADSVEQI